MSIYTDPVTGFHKHKCEKCSPSVIWEHPKPPEELSGEMVDRAHTCPVCGEEEWYKYGGKEIVTHPFNGWDKLPELKTKPKKEKKKKCDRDCDKCLCQLKIEAINLILDIFS